MSEKIRILVVEDSLTVRKRLVDVLNSEPDFQVVGEAETGREAFELCKKLRPDVITLDMVLPEMSGLSATEKIMAFCPTPILVVSASANRKELFKTYEALSAGALAVFEKPGADIPVEIWSKQLVRRVRVVSRVRVITHPRGRLARNSSPSPPSSSSPPSLWAPGSASNSQKFISLEQEIELVAIGASTGGPRAVLTILQDLPSDYPIPILLVIHIGATLGMAMADWLAAQTGMAVSFARDGEPLAEMHPGRVLMAPPDHHLFVEGDYLRLSQEAERNHCRPSVDVLFESVAQTFGSRCAGCLLTGMGRDGAHGLKQIQEAGGLTMAQDRETSVVFGMPGEAIRRGAARHILPLQSFAPALMELSAFVEAKKGAL